MNKSKYRVIIPDGIYVGNWTSDILTIWSQDYFGNKIIMEYAIRTPSCVCVVVVKDGIAHAHDKRIGLLDL